LIEKTIKEKEYVILTPRTTLPTPGKADVDVIILADPVILFLYLFLKNHNIVIIRMDMKFVLLEMKDIVNYLKSMKKLQNFWIKQLKKMIVLNIWKKGRK